MEAAMRDWLRRLNRKRKLLLAWNAIFVVLLAWVSVVIAGAPEFQGGQGIGLIAVMWLFAAAGFAFAWRAGK
jgi:hypothetical protein